MAVTSCVYREIQPSGGSVDERNRGVYVVGFDVYTNSTMGQKTVIIGAIATGPNALPTLWATYAFGGVESDTWSYLRQITPRHVANIEGGQKWEIDAQYRPLAPGETSDSVKDVNPLLRPASFWWETEVFTRVVEKDVFGNKIVNKAGTQYDVPLEQEETRGVLVASWNVSTLADAISLNRTYENHINSAGFLGAPVNTVLCRQMGSTPQQTEAGNTYFTMRARFAFKENGETWLRGVLERGYYFLEVDELGQAVTEPLPGNPNLTRQKLTKTDGDALLLDNDGTLLPDNQVGIFTDWQTRRSANFNNITNPLGQPIF